MNGRRRNAARKRRNEAKRILRIKSQRPVKMHCVPFLFIGGPANGRVLDVYDGLNVWKVSELKKPRSFLSNDAPEPYVAEKVVYYTKRYYAYCGRLLSFFALDSVPDDRIEFTISGYPILKKASEQ